MKVQKRLFALIRQRFASDEAMYQALGALLHKQKDYIRRKFKGESPLSLDDAIVLANTYGISLDGLGEVKKDTVTAHFISLVDDPTYQAYFSYLVYLCDVFEGMAKTGGYKIRFALDDLPLFSFADLHALTCFKLYARAQAYGLVGVGYQRFVDGFDTDRLQTLMERLGKAYQAIPSHEIWMDETFDSMMKLIRYHCHLGSFAGSEVPMALCDDMLRVLSELKTVAEARTKADYSSFSLYLSPIDVGATTLLAEGPKGLQVTQKLHMINSLTTHDLGFTREMGKWIDALQQKSHPLSDAGELERTSFFDRMERKLLAFREEVARIVYI